MQRLESEELPLDDALQLFEEGIRLSRFCNQKLEEVEKKIELILADSKGQPNVRPFEAVGSAGPAGADEDDDAGAHDDEETDDDSPAIEGL